MQKLKRLSSTLIFFLLFGNALIAKDSFVPGHLFTVNKDTIKGWIKIQDDADYASGCIFRVASNGPSQKFWLKDLTGFQLDNEKRCFKKRTVEHNYYPREVFLETVVEGKLSLYYWKDYGVGEVMYLSRQGDSLLVPLPYTRIKGNYGEWYMPMNNPVVSTVHQDTLFKYTDDRLDLQPEIVAIKKPTLANLTRLIMKYNGISDSAVVISRTKPLTKQGRFFIMPGFTNSDYRLLSRTSWDFYGGATFSFRFTGKFDMVTLNAGCYKRIVDGESFLSGAYSQYKIPLYLEYRFMGKFFRPFFSFGVDGFKNDYSTKYLFGPAVGFSIKLMDKLDFILRLSSDMEVIDYDYQHLLVNYNALTTGIQFQL